MKQKKISKIEWLSTHRRWPLAVAAIAVVLALPSLWGGLLADDYYHRLVIHRPASYPDVLPHALDTYRFADGDPDHARRLMDFGALTWYANPEFKAGFWRPLTSITQFVEHKAWPNSPWLMHLQSILWYGALALAVAFLFRRFMGVTLAAGLAALMFAIDDAHNWPVGFLANRHGLIACLFGVLALLMHDSWRREGKHAKGVAAVALFILALLSGEGGIGTVAYLAAYALFLDTGTWKRRAASLAPYLVVVIVWRIAWSAMGYGLEGTGLYTDPLREPLKFFMFFWIQAPLLITGQAAQPPAEIQGLITIFQPLTILLFAAIAGFFLWAAWRIMKKDRVARFFGAGALMALVPACASLPHNRNLMFAGIGAFALIGLWLAQLSQRTTVKRLTKAVAVVLIGIHFILAPLMLMLLSRFPLGPNTAWENFSRIPGMDEIDGRDLIIVNHPAPMLPYYYLGDRATNNEPLPAHTRVLGQVFSPVTVTRTSPTQIRVRCEYGFSDYFSRILNGLCRKMSVGDEVRVTGMTARVTEAEDTGLPIEAVFTFDRNLDDDSLVWMQWSEDSFKPFNPPAIGESVELEPVWLPFGLTIAKFDKLVRRAIY
ncbi:MAG: hypothetical protein E3J72_22170 [Planctomycetota bacterium]|nr:MAG: hypothetical protein E3J72_22170 [Planctomycetota bacterium]